MHGSVARRHYAELGFGDGRDGNWDLPVFPTTRPRGGDFLYIAEELDVMWRAIGDLPRTGLSGIVSGVQCN